MFPEFLQEFKGPVGAVHRITQDHRMTGLEETFKIIESNPCPDTSTEPWHQVPQPAFS